MTQLKLKVINNEIRLFPLTRIDIQEDLLINEEDWNSICQQCKEYQEIKLINNTLQIVCKEDITLQDLKDKKIKELKDNCQNYIIKTYSIYEQINIILQTNGYTETDKSNLINFINETKIICNTKETEIKNCTTEEELNKIKINFI